MRFDATGVGDGADLTLGFRALSTLERRETGAFRRLPTVQQGAISIIEEGVKSLRNTAHFL